VKALLTKVESVLSGLSWAAAYDNPDGGTIAMRAYTGVIPHKRNTEAQGSDFPYRLTKLTGFDLDRQGVRYNVSTEIGVYTSGDVDDGITLVDSIITIVKGVPAQAFAPFKLIDEVGGEVSSNEHPFYTVTLNCTFRGAS